MHKTNAYYRISTDTPCCLNCRRFECHYTTLDELRFYPAAYGVCTYPRLRLRGVATCCKHYENKYREEAKS